MSGLSTHILDTSLGLPASGVSLHLYKIEGDTRVFIKEAQTNADGRTDTPLLSGEELIEGSYLILFHVGDYLLKTHANLSRPLFLDQIPIQFGVSDTNTHYHVPLLISPFGYSTYRGS